ncbi:MAG TPA: L-type lectin-domain containing protein [Terriglobia bacterium]|nr:L-type lectin-domain containing protein [Terriglobia bacterium]
MARSDRSRAVLTAFLLLVPAAIPSPAQIQFRDFASVGNLSLVGDARVAGGALRITRAKGDKAGAFWVRDKQSVGKGFDTTFQFQLRHQDRIFYRGADGFAFVVQNSGPDALGGMGSAAGFGVSDSIGTPPHDGIPWAVAVFFDTYRNKEEDDPSSNYIGIRAAGGPPVSHWPPSRLAASPTLGVRLKDGEVHTARILFQPPVLSVFLDGSAEPVVKTVVDLSIATDPQGRAWVGFTAATGGGWQNHDILSWSFGRADVSSSLYSVTSDITFPRSACLPNRNLCTPESAFVEPSGAGYHVVLPADLEWGASVPNASGRPVAVANAKGIACWDLQAPGPQGCGGPSGSGGVAGAGFLAKGQPAGALIMRTGDGRTWFSVNGRGGPGFKANEGFYEFDVKIKLESAQSSPR